MISIILPQMPLLSILFCICLCSYTLIWCRIISHWICVLVPGFVLASLPLLSKCVWLAKFLFGDYRFPSQRSEFAFVSLIFQLSLFCSVASGAHRAIQIEPGQKKHRYLDWWIVMGVKIPGFGCGASLHFPYPQSHGDSPVWCHQRGQSKQNMGWGSSTILPAPPTKAESATFLSTNLPLLLSPSSFLPKSKNQICLHFWETRSFFFWCHETEALSALHFS